MGWLVPAHSVFFPTNSAWPWRAASSVNGLVTFAGNWIRRLGKTQAVPRALGAQGLGMFFRAGSSGQGAGSSDRELEQEAQIPGAGEDRALLPTLSPLSRL